MEETVTVREDEQLEDLQLKGLRILQKRRGFRFGMDAVLLADFARIHERAVFGDFGTGSGILPLLLMGRGKGACCEAFELQPEYAEMAARTMALNHLSDKVRVNCADVRQAPKLLGPCSLDAIVCNPPYGVPGTALHCPSTDIDTARHQDLDGLLPWLVSARLVLRGKGRISLIYPAPRLLSLMHLLEEAKLTPKRLRLVYPGWNKPANLALVEAVKDGKPLLSMCPPLVIYGPDGGWTEELMRIYHPEGQEERRE